MGPLEELEVDEVIRAGLWSNDISALIRMEV